MWEPWRLGRRFPGTPVRGQTKGRTWDLGTGNCFGLMFLERETVSGFPWLLGVVFGGGWRAGEQTLGRSASVGRTSSVTSRRALGVPGEAPGTAQAAPEPGVPAPDPLSPRDPHAPGEARGWGWGVGGLLPRGAAPARCLHPIPSLGQSPVPCMSPLFPGVVHTCLVAPPPMSRVLQGCLSVTSGGPLPPVCQGVSFLPLRCHLSLCCLPWSSASFPALVVALPFLHPESETLPTSQASVTTERPKKGKRTSRMWCTQSFAKDDTIGRVRWGVGPAPGVGHSEGGCALQPVLCPQVGRLHGSVPNLSRYLESRDHSGPRGLPPPDYAHLQRNFWALAQKGECEQEGGAERAGEAEGLMPLPSQCTARSAASWLPSPLNVTN